MFAFCCRDMASPGSFYAIDDAISDKTHAGCCSLDACEKKLWNERSLWLLYAIYIVLFPGTLTVSTTESTKKSTTKSVWLWVLVDWAALFYWESQIRNPFWNNLVDNIVTYYWFWRCTFEAIFGETKDAKLIIRIESALLLWKLAAMLVPHAKVKDWKESMWGKRLVSAH